MRSFILVRAHGKGHKYVPFPRAEIVHSAFHTIKSVVSQVNVLRTGLQACREMFASYSCEYKRYLGVASEQSLLMRPAAILIGVKSSPGSMHGEG